jgi:hypothetical protein
VPQMSHPYPGLGDRTCGIAAGTAFGPVNVAIHAISASLKLGDPLTATETGEALDLASMPVGLVGRRTQVNLDLARAYARTRKDAAAVNLLLAAERLSPQLVRYDPATRVQPPTAPVVASGDHEDGMVADGPQGAPRIWS